MKIINRDRQASLLLEHIGADSDSPREGDLQLALDYLRYWEGTGEAPLHGILMSPDRIFIQLRKDPIVSRSRRAPSKRAYVELLSALLFKETHADGLVEKLVALANGQATVGTMKISGALRTAGRAVHMAREGRLGWSFRSGRNPPHRAGSFVRTVSLCVVQPCDGKRSWLTLGMRRGMRRAEYRTYAIRAMGYAWSSLIRPFRAWESFIAENPYREEGPFGPEASKIVEDDLERWSLALRDYQPKIKPGIGNSSGAIQALRVSGHLEAVGNASVSVDFDPPEDEGAPDADGE